MCRALIGKWTSYRLYRAGGYRPSRIENAMVTVFVIEGRLRREGYR